MQKRRKKKTPSYSTASICEALRKTNGAIFLAAESLGCNYTMIYRRAKRSQKVRQVLRACEGKILDVSETALHRAVLKGEGWAVCFHLKTKGKKRGYIETQEQKHTGKVDHDHSIKILTRDDFYGTNPHALPPPSNDPSDSGLAITGSV